MAAQCIPGQHTETDELDAINRRLLEPFAKWLHNTYANGFALVPPTPASYGAYLMYSWSQCDLTSR
jgi:hypothetical protein